MPDKQDVIVVGGGVMAAAAAYHLALKGRAVTILEQGQLPNPYGASGDYLRVFRLTYGKDSFYTQMAAETLPLWLKLQEETGEQLLNQNGMLEWAIKEKGYEDDSYKVLKELKLPVEKIDKAQLKRQYPMLNTRAIRFGLFHKDGGMIWAMRATETLLHLAQKKGAQLRTQVKIVSIQRDKEGIQGVTDAHGKSWKAKDYLFCPGAWAGGLLKNFRLPIKVTRQQQIYLRPPSNRGRYRPEHFPVFASLSTGFYGFPLHIHGFLKIGDHNLGPSSPPPDLKSPQEITPQFIAKCRNFFKKFIPELANFTEMEGKVCHYANTPDKDFIMDRLPGAPNGYVAAGFSGHGFKFAPLIGKTMAELITGAKPELNLQRFRLDRFKRR